MLKRVYGIDGAYYRALLEHQGNRCAIPDCTATRLFIDHDHATNKVRGILCFAHNRGLGLYEKFHDEFAHYLQRPPAEALPKPES